jgi:hypothetical protein
LRLIPAQDRRPRFGFTRRRIGVLFGAVLAILLLSWATQKGGCRRAVPKSLPEHVEFNEPLAATVRELDDAIYLYVMFMAIEHDKWLASEASMVATSIELTGLPTKERAEDLLDHLPGVKKEIGKDIGRIHLLDSPAVEMMETGVVLYPKEGRALLLEGRTYTQDGYGGLIGRLEGAATCQFTAELKFLAGDYGDPGDLGDYRIRLAGTLENDRISLRWAGGRIGNSEKVRALLAAARLFEQVSASQTYRFDSDAEAERVRGLARRVAGDVSGIDIQRTPSSYVASDNTNDAAILLCYDRHAGTVFGAD